MSPPPVPRPPRPMWRQWPDRQLAAALAGLTAGAVLIGYVLGAGLFDRSPGPQSALARAAATPPPAPVATPETEDPFVGSGAPGAPPRVRPLPPGRTSPSGPSVPAPAGTGAPAPAAPTYRPPPSTPLPEYVVPADELPPDAAAATGILQDHLAAAAPGSVEAQDIRWVLDLGRRFAVASAGVPDGRRATVERALRVNAWWYGRRSPPPGRALLRDADGIIHSYRAGHGFAPNPVGTTGRWQRLNAAFSAAQLAAALLPMGVAQRAGGIGFRTWEYYDVPDAPDRISPGTSGMAQARVAELFAHAYHETGDERYAQGSLDAMAAFEVPVDDGGATTEVAYPPDTPPSPWYVERAYPGANPWKGAALNGFMVAILALGTTEQALRDPPDRAQAAAAPPAGGKRADESPGSGGPAHLAAAGLAARLADEGAATLQRYLPLHDSGSWSFYGMLTPGRPWRTYLASLNYHCYHVSLLRRLGRRYPESTFRATSARWKRYVADERQTCPA